MLTRPSIKTPCVADRHHIGCERIAEFMTPNGEGGLIAVRESVEGIALVEVYRTTSAVKVVAPRREHMVWSMTASTDDGVTTEVFPTEYGAKAAFRREVEKCWTAFQDRLTDFGDEDAKMPEDAAEAYDMLCEIGDFSDQFIINHHTVEL